MATKVEIEWRNARYMEMFKKGEFANLARDIYTSDCKILLPHMPMISGRDAGTATFQAIQAKGVAELVIDVKVVEAAGPYTLDRGEYVMKTADGQVADKGNYFVIWKKEDGAWKIYYDAPVTAMPEKS